MKTKPEMVLSLKYKNNNNNINKQTKPKSKKKSNLEIWANIPPDFSNPLLSSLLFLRHTVEPQ